MTMTSDRDRRSPLPRGRHSLSRDVVEKSQRSRLESAIIDVVSGRGFLGTTVADVVTAAAVSRQTFYAFYEDKAECYDRAVARFATQVAEAAHAKGHGRGGWQHRLRRVSEVLAAEPVLAHCLLVERAPHGPATAGALRELRSVLIDVFDECFGTARSDRSAAFAAMFVQLAADAVASGQAKELTGLGARIARLVRGPVRSSTPLDS